MGFIDFLKNMRDNYLINEVQKVQIPEFKEGREIRRHLIFSGKVQRVGFRLETLEMGKRLGLKGWVKNLPDGRVEAEVQGSKDRIDFLINHLNSIKRINIEDIETRNIDLSPDKEFKGIY